MPYENILTETRGRVGLVTLNRPKQLNALNDALMDELGLALRAFDDERRLAEASRCRDDRQRLGKPLAQPVEQPPPRYQMRTLGRKRDLRSQQRRIGGFGHVGVSSGSCGRPRLPASKAMCKFIHPTLARGH